MTSPFNNGGADSGPSWGAGGTSDNANSPAPKATPGPASGNAAGGGSPFGGSPFGGNVDFSPGSSPATGPVSFGGPPSSDYSATVTTPVSSLTPVSGLWRFVGAGVATASIGVLLGIAAPVTGSATSSPFHLLAIVGWVLAGIVTFILLGLHTMTDARRQAENYYIGNPAQKTVYAVATGLACVGVIITAVEIALWISKTVGA